MSLGSRFRSALPLRAVRSRTPRSVSSGEFLLLGRALAERVADASTLLTKNAFAELHPHRVLADDFQIYAATARSHPRIGFFDGYVFAHELHHGRHNPPSPRALGHIFAESASLAGNFLVGEVDTARRTFEFRRDVFGHYPLWYYGEGKDFGVSNNPYALAAVLERSGRPVGRNPENVCLNVLYLTGFGRAASFTTLRLLPPRHGIRFTPKHGFEIFEHTRRDELFEADGDYADLLEEVATEIARNCSMVGALAEAGVHTVVDLSGGVDTRLVLAGMLNAGRAQSVKFFNVNRDPHGKTSDRVIAEMVTARYRLIPGRGVTGHPAQTGTINSRKNFTPGGAFAHSAGHYSGLLPVRGEDFGELYLDGYCRAGGYCGEHTRAVGADLSSILDSPTPTKLTRVLLKHRVEQRRDNAADLLTPAGLAAVRDEYGSYFGDVLETVPDAKLVSTATYIENRSRFHFGLRSANANRSRISVAPLLTPRVLALHDKLSYEQLRQNKIGHDLMMRLGGPELTYHPFADYEWGPEAVGTTPYPTYLERLNAAEPVEGRPMLDGFSLRGHDSPFADSPYDAWLRQRGERQSRANALRFLLESIPSTDLVWGLVDRAAVAAAVEEDMNSKREKNVNRLISSLMFYGGLSTTSRLREHVDVREVIPHH